MFWMWVGDHQGFIAAMLAFGTSVANAFRITIVKRNTEEIKVNVNGNLSRAIDALKVSLPPLPDDAGELPIVPVPRKETDARNS